MSRDYLKVWSLVGILIFLFIQNVHANEDEIMTVKGGDFEILYHEPLPPINLVRKSFDPANPEKEAPSWEWVLEAFGKEFQFDLEPNDRLIAELPKEKREKIAEIVELYRGKIQGIDDSWIRLTKIGEDWSGMFWDGTEAYIIDPLPILSLYLRVMPFVGEFTHGIYRLSDTKNLTQVACGVEGNESAVNGLASFQALSQELEEGVSASAVGASLNIDLAIVTDPLFTQIQQESFDTQNDAAVLARVNVVDGIFSGQVDVQINLVEIVALSENGPLTSTDSGTLLSQFGNYTDTPPFNHPGVAHLFTGRDLNGNVIGRAYLSSLCSSRYGVGINEIRQGGTVGSVLFAHELGHNFGAPHDNENGSACASTPGGFIMSPVINNSQEFSECSIEQMQPEINASSCITVIDNNTADVLLNLEPSPFTAPLATPFDYDLEVQNSGNVTAHNVNAEVNVSNGLTILNAKVGATMCSISGSTQADCSIGDIPAGQNRIITVSLEGQNAGQETLDAEISADNDQNSANNTKQGTINLTNTAPTVTIMSPQDGTFLTEGSSLSFEGKASDIEDGNLDGQIQWASDLDGQVGTGSSFSATLSVGTHLITASVTDSGGLQSSTSISVTVGPAGANVIDWIATLTEPYSNQDGSGTLETDHEGRTLILTGNRWRRTNDTFTITPDTILAFEFQSGTQGEIHGIGFDEDNDHHNGGRIFTLDGTQSWSGDIDWTPRYPGTGGFVSYSIPVGEYYTGSGFRLVVVNDKDAGTLNNTSRFRNVLIYEVQAAPVTVPDVVGQTQSTAETMIEDAGLVVGTVTTQSSNTVAAGNVISQEPTGGTQAAAGSAVNLVVSSGPPPSDVLDWNATSTVAYSNQDGSGSLTIEDNGNTLFITGNRWRRTNDTFTITPDTILEFEFQSDAQGELHGIGFDEDNDIHNGARIFTLDGTQSWSGDIDWTPRYPGTGGFVSYSIPVGEYYTGSGFRLVVVNDKDAGTLNNTSRFRNIRIYEK